MLEIEERSSYIQSSRSLFINNNKLDLYWWIPFILYLVIIAVIAPWGNFPLNDDWQYALVVKRLLELGKVWIETPIAPSLVGQVLWVFPWVKLFGFSHQLLRGVTLGMSILGLRAMDRLMVLAGTPALARALGLILFIVNPLFLYLSTTFMNEMYGFVPALWIAVLWFSKCRGKASHPTWLLMILVSVLSGLLFWVRQFAVLVYPALLGAWLLDRGWCFNFKEKENRAVILKWLVGILIFSGVILLYFPWAKSTGNFKQEFAIPLSRLTSVNPETFFKEIFIFLIYAVAYFYPLFFLMPIQVFSRKKVVTALLFTLLFEGALIFYRSRVFQPYHVDTFVHQGFPFLGNIIYNAGIGPITLEDVYEHHLQGRPQWPVWIWRCVEALTIFGSCLFLSMSFSALLKKRKSYGGVITFSVLLSSIIFFVTVQVYGNFVYDRYHFPVLLFLLPALITWISLPKISPQFFRARIATFLIACMPLGFFSIAGVHDEFRWNEVRWSLFDEIVKSGVSPFQVDGGYEVNGWNRHVYGALNGLTPNKKFYIGMNLMDGFEVVHSIQPVYWLVQGPPVILAKPISYKDIGTQLFHF